MTRSPTPTRGGAGHLKSQIAVITAGKRDSTGAGAIRCLSKSARREGAEPTTIYDQPITQFHTVPTDDGGLEITFVAKGLYAREREASQYRYTVILSPDELTILNGTDRQEIRQLDNIMSG